MEMNIIYTFYILHISAKYLCAIRMDVFAKYNDRSMF